MDVNLNSLQRIAAPLLLLLSVLLAGCASGPSTPPPDLLQRIETARTRSDHESLVTYYEQQAAAARASAAEHRKMAARYPGITAGGRGGESSMASHCNAIVRSKERIAAEYDGMALGHRQMAEQAKP